MSDALEKGIAIGKANIFGNPQKKAEAIEYFKQALLENPKEVQAWLWIANLVDNDTPTRKYCFQKVLELDPQNTYARQMLDFILETEPNFKWIKEQASPLQPFFDSLQRPQPPFLSGQPYHSNQPPHQNQPYRPTAQNFRNAATPVQSPRPAYAQAKPKKKDTSLWLPLFLVSSVLVGIVSIAIVFIMSPYSSPEVNTVGMGLGVFMGLEILLAELFWIISGYAGVYKLIKKGYLLEFIGCSLILAGIPLILPILLGPILYAWADRVKEKYG
jgi:hypothetical protein